MKLLLALPIILIVLVSGCTIPGLGDIIPGFGTSDYEHDVVVIKEITAFPSTVNKNQPVRLITYIENQGSKTIPLKDGPAGKVKLTLYDYCPGLFLPPRMHCNGQEGPGTTCEIDKLLPKEIVEVDWTIQPNPATKLTTRCDFKVAVSYPYKTLGVTTIHFISPSEYQRRLELGDYAPIQSDIQRGEGPIKTHIEVKDQQPIPANGGQSVVALLIENEGRGFLSWPAGVATDSARGPYIPKGQVKVEFPSGVDGIDDECPFSKNSAEEDVRLIRNAAPPLICKITIPSASDVASEITKSFTAEISYNYEFRVQTPVTVEVIA